LLFNIRHQCSHIGRYPSWGQPPHRRLTRFRLGGPDWRCPLHRAGRGRHGRRPGSQYGRFIHHSSPIHGPAYVPACPFLTEVAPDIAVISSGVDNRYGHPHTAVLGRLSEVGAAVLRTDELGTIEVISDGEAMWWEAKP
jgi:hypothetical protein